MQSHLNNGEQLTESGGNIRNIKQTHSGCVGGHHGLCTCSLSQKHQPKADHVQDKYQNRTTISLFVGHSN